MPKLTWYGHSAFQLEDDAGNIVIIDPFIKDNPVDLGRSQDRSSRARSCSRTPTTIMSEIRSTSRNGTTPK